MGERRGSFGPVVVVGLAAAVLTAVASARPWMAPVPADGGSRAVVSVLVDGGQMPLATTLAMVVLATWGVVLVTRGWWRTTVAVLGSLAAAGVLATVVSGWWLVPRTLRDAARDLGAGDVGTEVRAWFWLALTGAALSLLATVVAVPRVRGWPEMGTRYDAPTSPVSPDSPTSTNTTTGADAGTEPTNLDLWKAMDEGRDPTT